MLIIVFVAVLFLVTDATYWLAGGSWRRRGRARRDPLDHPIRTPELRELDARLEQIALEELRRLERQLARYVASEVGHVLMISRSPHGIALELSDGRRLALGGVSQRTRHLLAQRAAGDKLRPAHVHRDAFSYRLLLRGLAGAEIEIHARQIALAP
ncbi:MAG: hypothetical protein QOG10_1603 [Kribbellaceae bacterium]|jgi:hypothetical protein|nr:hypothetical protein [Kribbellaceae bacterium]